GLNAAALAAGFRAEQHRDVVAEVGDRRILLRSAQAAVETREPRTGSREKAGEAAERLARMNEDELLLFGVAGKQVEQRLLLAAGFDCGPAFGQRAPFRIVGAARREPRH